VTKITWENFNSISFSDSLNGLVVGNNGVIFKTSNCGLDWHYISTGSYYTLNSISYIRNKAIAAGDNGTVLTSTDDGITWKEEQRISYNSFYSTDILNYNLFAFGEFGSIIKTTSKKFSANIYMKNTNIGKHLSGNHPNPFNSQTVISYSLTVDKFVEVKIYDVLGKKISTFVNKIQGQGIHSVIWDATQFPGGIYLYSIEADGFLIDSGKMLQLK